jgi:hypothetical protein
MPPPDMVNVPPPPERRRATALADADADDTPPAGIFLSAEYLLLKPRRRDLDFAISSPQNLGVPIGNVESLQWSWDSGVRVGVGYAVPGEGWDVGLYYTYFHSTAGRALAAPDGGVLFATLTHPGLVQSVLTANAASRLNMHILDLEAGRTFSLGRCFDVRFFGGGRYAWVDQGFNVLYDGGDANGDLVTAPINFDGGGLRAGVEGVWHLGWGFGVYMKGSGSLLMGRFQTSLTETNDNGATPLTDATNNFDKLVPVSELAAGVTWQRGRLSVTVGYEMANWFGLVDSPDFVDDVHQGKLGQRTSDLSLDGLMAEVGLQF